VLLNSLDIPEKELAEIDKKMNFNTNLLMRMVLMLFDSSDTMALDSSIYKKGDKVLCNQVGRESIDYVQTHFENVKVRFESEVSDDFSIKTSHLFLMRTLREIVYNAAKYSDGQHICLSITKTPTTVRFTIEDVGPGLPPDSLDMIYKPFMKVDDLSDGLGLGLPLSKRHITGLGGELIYDADYKEGCRFIVELPL
jgi:signal transduction histidine kinase